LQRVQGPCIQFLQRQDEQLAGGEVAGEAAEYSTILAPDQVALALRWHIGSRGAGTSQGTWFQQAIHGLVEGGSLPASARVHRVMGDGPVNGIAQDRDELGLGHGVADALGDGRVGHVLRSGFSPEFFTGCPPEVP
jgi:hypothetical protein